MVVVNSYSETRPDILKLALAAHQDKNIYHQKNVEANRRGDCKENIERLLDFFRVSGFDLAEFTVMYIERYDDDGYKVRVAVDKSALRPEEQSIMIRQIFTGHYRRKQMLWKLHFLLLDKENRVYDLSGKAEFLGMKFADYYETLFKIELAKNREDTMHEIELYICPADKYFSVFESLDDAILGEFERISTERLLKQP